MSQKKIRLISSLLIFIFILGSQIYKEYFRPTANVLSIQNNGAYETTEKEMPVVKVVDGDTLDVLINNKKERVRVLGINTPETVDPRRPVECFGLEASNKAKELLANQTVRLEPDPTQSDRDKYGRMLAYIFLSNGTDFGLLMIKQGYAYEYTFDSPYKFQTQYKAAQKEAEKVGAGLWGLNACSVKK